MSQVIGIGPNLQVRSFLFWGLGPWVRRWVGSPGGVEGQVAEEFAGGGVDDADVEVLDEQDDAGVRVGSADADVVEAPGVAEGDVAGLVDEVVADAVVGVVVRLAGGWLWVGRVGVAGVARCGSERWGRRWLYSSTNWSSRAWSSVMVAGCGSWARSHFFMVCWNRSTLPQVVGWLGREFFWVMFRRRSSFSRALRPPLPPAKRVVKTMPLSVRVDAGIPWWATHHGTR